MLQFPVGWQPQPGYPQYPIQPAAPWGIGFVPPNRYIPAARANPYIPPSRPDTFALAYRANMHPYPSYPQANANATTPVNSSEPLWKEPKWIAVAGGAATVVGLAAYALLRKKPPPTVSKAKLPPLNISPRLQDPNYCSQVAYNIADETYPALVKLYQDKANNPHWDEQAEQLMNQAIRKHLNPDVKIHFDFLEPYATAYRGCYHFKTSEFRVVDDLVQGKPKPVYYIGQVEVCKPKNPLDLSKPHQYQEIYSTLVHELRHMIREFASNPAIEKEHLYPKKGHPLQKLFSRHFACPESEKYLVLTARLLKDKPSLPELPLDPDTLSTWPKEQMQKYWQELLNCWNRTDFPFLASDLNDFAPELKKLCAELDPKYIDNAIERRIANELESYMTVMKRAPGIKESEIFPNDFIELSRALYLRDLMRFCYRERNIPVEKQHPFAQIKPIQLFSKYIHRRSRFGKI